MGLTHSSAETVELLHFDKTDTILLGPVIGTFSEPVSGDVSAAGKIVRVHVRGVDGYVDINISPAVNAAVRMLTE